MPPSSNGWRRALAVGFTHETAAQRVTLGSGIAAGALARDLTDLGAQRVMLIVSGSAQAAADIALAEIAQSGFDIAVRWHEVRRHVPIDLVTRARAAAVAAAIDTIVSVGGGSATGLAKAVALEIGARIIALPTTFSGSEATNIWGITDGGVKTTGADPTVLPAAVIYDTDFTRTLPPQILGASALNALAHCIDALWAPGRTPISDATALAGVESLMSALPRLAADPQDPEAHEEGLLGVYHSGVALAVAGSGMHHKICHVLGGRYDLPHAQTHAVLLPHVVAYNAPGYAGIERLARAMGVNQAEEQGAALAVVAAVREAGSGLSLPVSLAEVGVREEDLDEAAAECVAVIPESNPVPVTVESIRRLLHRAWAGHVPTME